MYDLNILEQRVTSWITGRTFDWSDIEDENYHSSTGRHTYIRTRNPTTRDMWFERAYKKAPLIKRCNGVEEEE